MKESDCKDDIDKWIFNLSNMDTMETSLSFSDEIPAFVRLGKMASYSALTPQQQIQYDDSFNNYLAFMGQQEYKLKEGIKIGVEQGLAQGRAEGEAQTKLSIARYLKSLGTMTMEQIATATQLPISQIQSL